MFGRSRSPLTEKTTTFSRWCNSGRSTAMTDLTSPGCTERNQGRMRTRCERLVLTARIAIDRARASDDRCVRAERTNPQKYLAFLKRLGLVGNACNRDGGFRTTTSKEQAGSTHPCQMHCPRSRSTPITVECGSPAKYDGSVAHTLCLSKESIRHLRTFSTLHVSVSSTPRDIAVVIGSYMEHESSNHGLA